MIAEKEGAEIEPTARFALIARAADGSVRDGLSLLDQAIGPSAPARSPRSRSATCSASPTARACSTCSRR